MVVGNTLFGHKWKIPSEKQSNVTHGEGEDKNYYNFINFDADTKPTTCRICQMLKNIYIYIYIYAHSLKLTTERVIKTKEEDAVITHASDSTRR